MAQRGFRFPWSRRTTVVEGSDAGLGGPPTATATLTFLGTSAALPAADRANSMLAITQPGEPGVLIDCGAGVVQALTRARMAPDTISDILVTHAHIDHCGDLPSLLEAWRIAGRTAPLRVIAMPETMTTLTRLLDLFSFELTLDDWPFKVELVSADLGDLRLGPYDARLVRMDHAVPSVGVRLNLPGGVLAYTCDTQPNPNIAVLAEGAALFITECTFTADEVPMARLSRHMTSAEVGEVAQANGIQRLAIVHLGVGEAPNFLARVRAEIKAKYTGELIIPSDGDTLTL